jgi:hypothetical protein
MSTARFALLVTAVGFIALVAGLALSPEPWLAPVVGGALLIGLGVLVDEPKKPKRSP